MLKKKKTYIWAAVILAAIIGGYLYLNSKKPKTTYTTQDVKRGTLSQTVSVTGKLFAPEMVSASFQTGGQIDKIYVDTGDVVKKGDRIARIDPASLIEAFQAAEKDVTYQKRILDDMRRNKNTYGGKKREAQSALVKKSQDLLEQARINLNEAVIYSPIDGTVISRSKEEGENVSLNEEVAVIAGFGELEIRSNVPESDIVKVKIGQKAKVAFDALDSEDVLTAEVVDIDPASTVIQDVVYYRVKFRLNSPDQRLKIGMSEDLDIMTASRENALMIPLRAVKTEGTDKFVEVLKDEVNNVTEKIKITTGLEGDEGMVEVTSGNLKEGDKVITLVNAPK